MLLVAIILQEKWNAQNDAHYLKTKAPSVIAIRMKEKTKKLYICVQLYKQYQEHMKAICTQNNSVPVPPTISFTHNKY